ncbi:MAG TPA: hypothetical protein VMV94_01905 [Phycisphaerae bacterium]|nr:hypothetical protein [Phycisphaerae bacterium]
MAGVAPQQRGSNATTIGLVVLILVVVVLLVGLIWMFTQQEGLRKTAQDEQAKRARIASSADESAARQMFPDATGPNKTLVGEMNKGIQELCGRLTGNQTDQPKVALEKLNAALKSIAESDQIPDKDQLTTAYGAASIIETLTQLVIKERESSTKAEADLNKALADLDALSKDNKELGEKFQGELAKMQTSVAALQNGKSEFEKTKAGEIEAYKQKLDQMGDELQATVRDQDKLKQRVKAELEKRDRDIAEQRLALSELRGPPARGAQELALAKKPVGTVLRRLPGNSLVDIDLGREDNVTLGMTFAVYSADAQVPEDGRGKANIEVVSLGEKTAECKVTTPPSPDNPILEGDYVGNIILSRNKAKKPQFCIVGDFDVDYDGAPDARGREVMKALVKRYGGEVVDSVTAATDYLVVGVEPEGGPTKAEPGTGAVKGAEEPAAREKEEGEKEKPAKEEKAPKVTKKEKEEKEAGEEEAGAEEEGEEKPAAEEEEPGAEEEKAKEAGKGGAAGKAKGPIIIRPKEEAEEEPGDEEEEKPADEETGAGKAQPKKPAAGAEEPPAKPKGSLVPIEIKRPTAVEPTAGPRERRLVNERDRYYEAVRRAEMFSIPRLPQDRFLNFVGIEPGPSAARRLQP